MSTTMQSPVQAQRTFRVVYAAELAQYVVEGGEFRVVPTATPNVDPQAERRALGVCATLNRVYGGERVSC